MSRRIRPLRGNVEEMVEEGVAAVIVPPPPLPPPPPPVIVEVKKIAAALPKGWDPTADFGMRSDICTEYRKTGRCRKGEMCKFAHVMNSGHDEAYSIKRARGEEGVETVIMPTDVGTCVACHASPCVNPMRALKWCPRHTVCAECVRAMVGPSTKCPAANCNVDTQGEYSGV